MAEAAAGREGSLEPAAGLGRGRASRCGTRLLRDLGGSTVWTFAILGRSGGIPRVRTGEHLSAEGGQEWGVVVLSQPAPLSWSCFWGGGCAIPGCSSSACCR